MEEIIILNFYKQETVIVCDHQSVFLHQMNLESF